MKFSSSIIIASLLVALTASVPAQTEEAKTTKYIIKLKPGASRSRLTGLLTTFAASGNKVRHTYRANFFNGVAGDFTEEFITQIRTTYGNQLEYVEKDGIMKALANSQQPSPPSWGLSRISTRPLNLQSPFIYHSYAGRGVKVYVVDTGLQFSHSDFGGRATLDKSIVTGETEPDANGHGTHCSGTVASTTYGVAKNVQVLGVKVLNGAGSGTYSDVIAGIDYVASKANKATINTVMSMSLGGPSSPAVNQAVDAAVDAGVVTIVAAGNNNGDACTLSPSGASKVFAVGATDKTDTRATYSNYGKCVKLFAPGSDITSLWKGANGAKNTISGTSMATPHVAGVAALYLAEKSFTSVQAVYNALIAAATKNVVKNPGAASPNLLLFSQNVPARRE